MSVGSLASTPGLQESAPESRITYPREGPRCEHGILGESPALLETVRLVRLAAAADSTVLILGESGTGKELAARAIYRHSPRAHKPFVALNCAALTATLLESELFGYERGAFTGAFTQKRGKLELADGGTVFLDEIGEMPPALQAKLLRVLQEREFERVGGTRPVCMDVRLIAATNRDLAAAVAKGTFRPDLFYRLNVVALTMPPLRERFGDVSLLADFFLQKFASQTSPRVRRFSQSARRALNNYHWPGNVRELENAIERAVVLSAGEVIELDDLPQALREPSPDLVQPRAYHAFVDDARRQIILRSLEKAGGSYTRAARLLGLRVTYLHRLVRNLNLKPVVKNPSVFFGN